MTLHLVFVFLVVLGFIFNFAATWPAPFPGARLGWGCWMVASLIWAMGSIGGAANASS
jgi:hypothetical protein